MPAKEPKEERPARIDRKSRYRGCLAGLALGDALGAPVEFESLSTIRSKYGVRGITELQPWDRFPAGYFTDDTQMSLATARGCMRFLRDGGNPYRLVLEEYRAWRRTQTNPAEIRSPGGTCLDALGSGGFGTMDSPINDSKGCGGVMRVAPAGLAWPPGSAFDPASRFAALTHGHPTGHLAGGFLAELIAALVEGRTLSEALRKARRPLTGRRGHEETLNAVQRAEELAASTVTAPEGIQKLGEGWVADEALAIAVFCSLRNESDFRKGVTAAVNHSGDSDSTGCLTGAILGTRLGFGALPGKWVAALERREEILSLADELFELRRRQPPGS